MAEPNNPLFEDEKEFLERKKLEYERALRGDVEEIKEQTIHAGKVALVGAGIAGGVWLLVKAFSGSKAKKKHKKHKRDSSFEDYAGFDGYEGYDDDDHDQELDSLATAYHSPEYAYDHANRYAEEDGFYQEGSRADYFQDEDEDSEADDNGLSDYPDFPAHSSPQHGADAYSEDLTDTDTTYGSHADTGMYNSDSGVYHTDEDHGDYDQEDTEPAHSFASANSYQARPYDDSRRLPESNSFAEPGDEEKPAQPTVDKAAEPKKPWLIPAVMAFAQSETGKVLVAQAAAMALAFVSSKVKDILPRNEDKAGKNADLAHSSALAGASPAVWPATTAAQDASAAAHHDANTNTPREPLA
ncbi:hypothetical protein FNT36_07530 [Hymenobacter setariae]|uniref:Uncharacterized protein n=1 Tax=Hymenobacter setariae TaxID=2594794 RepID=A0A558BXR0_9BACT|nr:hypothetical protein [Hymenobacter setariae]TVT41298.1 hypothetical protein FNT36_07530 [Hymenobacter setariae]